MTPSFMVSAAGMAMWDGALCQKFNIYEVYLNRSLAEIIRNRHSRRCQFFEPLECFGSRRKGTQSCLGADMAPKDMVREQKVEGLGGKVQKNAPIGICKNC